MKIGRCPVCKNHLHIESIIQDDAAREMMSVLNKLDMLCRAAAVSYIGLFRSATRDLANDRALKLIKEVLALDTNNQRLTVALSSTVENMRIKQEQQSFKPLNNHNYLNDVSN